MTFAYHGNYCGPGWTAGKFEDAESSDFGAQPIDSFDRACYNHDKAYANGDYLVGDKDFLDEPSSSFKHYLAKTAIRGQYLLRKYGVMSKKGSTRKSNRKTMSNGAKSGKRMASSMPKRLSRRRRSKSSRSSRMPLSVPAAYTNNTTQFRNQARIGNTSLSSRNMPVRLNGREFLGNVTSTAEQVPGTILKTQQIAPQYLANGRLAAFSALFEKYRFEKVRISYSPQVGTGTAGQIFNFFDYDPTDPVDDGDISAVYRASNASDSIDLAVWRTASLGMSQKLRQTSFYTSMGVDPRNEIQAMFYVISNYTTTTAIQLGSLVMEYTIAFYGGEIQPTDSSSTAASFEMSLFSNRSGWTSTSGGKYLPVETGGTSFSTNGGVDLNLLTDRARFEAFGFTPGIYQMLASVTITPSGSSPTMSFSCGSLDTTYATTLTSSLMGAVSLTSGAAYTAVMTATVQILKVDGYNTAYTFDMFPSGSGWNFTLSTPIFRAFKLASTLSNYNDNFDENSGYFTTNGTRKVKLLSSESSKVSHLEDNVSRLTNEIEDLKDLIRQMAIASNNNIIRPPLSR